MASVAENLGMSQPLLAAGPETPLSPAGGQPFPALSARSEPLRRSAAAACVEKRYDDSEEWLVQAIQADPDNPLLWFERGSTAFQAGWLEKSIEFYRRAIELKPDLTEARVNLGLSLQNVGRPLEAIEQFQLLAEAQPQSAESQWNLGNAFHHAYQPDEALKCFQHAIRIDPAYARAYNSAARLLVEDGRLDDALALCRQAIAIDPGRASAHHALACVLRDLDRAPEALVSFHRALELDPKRFDTCFNHAHLLMTTGRNAEAEAAYRRTLAIKSDEAQVHNALGTALKEQGKLAEALESFQRALVHDPKCGLAHCNIAFVNLMLGDYSRGWAEYEWRWHCPGGPRPRNYFKQPPWNGDSLSGQTILVHNEQGLGDEIMFATCFPDLIARAGHCVLACDRRLAPLLARSFPQATVLGMTRGREHTFRLPAEPHIDVQIPAGSLPRYLRRDAASFPRDARLLVADPVRVQFWRQRLGQLGPGLKVGMSWRAGLMTKDRRTRWTRPADWAEVLSLPGAHFVSLQYGDCQQDIAEFENACGVRLHGWPDCDPRQNVDDLASQIGALDLVISVGNANVHLAGALGVPTWSIIPRYTDWCWGLEVEQCMWYASVRLFRQETMGRWENCFRQIHEALRSKLAASR